MSGRPGPASVIRRCAFDGCSTLVRNELGYCPTHYSVAYACVFDESCRNRCAAHSRTRLCQEHAWYTRKQQQSRASEE